MKQQLVKFLNGIHFFSNNQYGFREGKRTEDALLDFESKVLDGINNGDKIGGLFLDITKAFDCVNHNILLDTLWNCGIRGLAHDWFKTYLTERKQCVRVGECVSDCGI